MSANNTNRINTEYNIIRIIHNILIFSVYYLTLKGYSQVLGPIRDRHGLWISNDGFSSIFAHFTAQVAGGKSV